MTDRTLRRRGQLERRKGWQHQAAGVDRAPSSSAGACQSLSTRFVTGPRLVHELCWVPHNVWVGDLERGQLLDANCHPCHELGPALANGTPPTVFAPFHNLKIACSRARDRPAPNPQPLLGPIGSTTREGRASCRSPPKMLYAGECTEHVNEFRQFNVQCSTCCALFVCAAYGYYILYGIYVYDDDVRYD
jgi:hypothetical protein